MSQRSDFLSFAVSQIGTIGGDKYRAYYNKRVADLGASKWPWCAAGITYCAAKAGVDKNVITPTASSSVMLNGFKKAGRFKASGSYTPEGGDIIFFRWADNNTTAASHVGIVEYTQGGYVHTIEFNSGSLCDGSVARWKHPLAKSSIAGYGVPAYKKDMVRVINKTSYIRQNPWLDPLGGTSEKLKTLKTGACIEHISDDGYGWSKVKSGSLTGYIQNSRIGKTGITKYRRAKLTKKQTAVSVKGSEKRTLSKGSSVTFICCIDTGVLKGKSIVTKKGVSYYVDTPALRILRATLK